MATIELSMDVTGWFQIGWSDQVAPGAVLGLKYFGRELIAWRSESGVLHVLDAYCEHLGAHLGYGGSVNGECIACPFHGWEWDGEGRNVRIPYQDRPNKARRIPSWTSAEKNGIIYLWHDANGYQPPYDVPDIFEDLFEDDLHEVDYYPVYPQGTVYEPNVAIHPQYVTENGVDYAHFQFVHRAHETPEFVRQDFDDHFFRADFTMTFGGGKASTVQTPEGAVEGGVRSVNCGVSLGFSRFWGPDEQRSSVGVTPVDDQHSDIFHNIWLNRVDDSPFMPDSQERRMKLAKAQFLADLEIWKHIRYTDPPGLAAGEVRGFNALRRWAKRFYPDTPEYQEYAKILAG